MQGNQTSLQFILILNKIPISFSIYVYTTNKKTFAKNITIEKNVEEIE